MNRNLILLSILGLLVSSVMATIPYWVILLPGIDAGLMLFVGFNNLMKVAVAFATVISSVLILGVGRFSVVFVPGILFAAIAMALWSGKILLPKIKTKHGDKTLV